MKGLKITLLVIISSFFMAAFTSVYLEQSSYKLLKVKQDSKCRLKFAGCI